MEEEYLILQCPACERNVKIRSNAAGTRMGCPYCKEPIDVIDPDQESAFEEADDPVERPPLEFRKIQHTDGGSISHEPKESQSHGDGKPAAVRQKRRKRQIETPDWDADPSAQSEDGGQDGAPLDDDSSEFLEMDPNSPGGVRLKRVRRKKLQTKKEKFVRALTVSVFVVAAAIAGVIIYSAIVQTGKVIGTDKDTLANLPEEVRKAIEEVMAQEKPISLQLTKAEEEAAAAILRAFLTAKTVDERVKFVRNQEQMKPIMEEWYSNNPEEAERTWPEPNILKRKKIEDQGRYFIILVVEFTGIGYRFLAIEQRSKDDMKLDWATSVGYQPLPLEEFKASRPAQPVKFWAKLKPSDYYNFQFSDQERYFSVDLSYPGQLEFSLTGYLDRTKEWTAPLIARIEEGEGPSLVIELQYPPAAEPQDSSQVEIISIVSDTWWP